MGIAHLSIVFASFGMTTGDHLHLWKLMKQGTVRALNDGRPLMSTEPFQMLLGAIQTVDIGKNGSEEVKDNLELLNSICQRDDI